MKTLNRIIKIYSANVVLILALLAGIFAASTAVSLLVSDNAVDAQSSLACEGLEANGGFCDDDSSPEVNGILATALNLLSIAAGIAAVIMLIIGGTKYITSQGDSGGVNSAKNTIIYAVFGLIIVVVAQTLVYFFINQSTGNAP